MIQKKKNTLKDVKFPFQNIFGDDIGGEEKEKITNRIHHKELY